MCIKVELLFCLDYEGCAVPALSDRDKCNALWEGRQLPKSPPLNTS